MLITIRTLHASQEISRSKEGNFGVRTAATPSPLFANGQNILDECDFFVHSMASFIHGHTETLVVYQNELTYGLTDNFSVLLAPTYLHAAVKEGGKKIISKGFSDLPLQFEYAYFNKHTEKYSLQATILGAVILPTGSSEGSQFLSAGSGHIPTGFGATSYLFGGTVSYLDVDRYAFFDIIGWPTMTNRYGFKAGQTVFYDGGISCNLKHLKKWIMMLGLECNGFFTSRDTLLGKKDPNSGGNTIFLGPALFISSNHCTIQAGIQASIYQHLFGVQDTTKWRGLLNIGIIF